MKKMKKWFRSLALMLVLVLAFSGFAGCGTDSEEPAQTTAQQNEEVSEALSEMAETVSEIEEVIDDSQIEETTESEAEEETETEAETELADDSSDELYLDPDGTYDSKEDVALYLYLYGELPSNYITKKEAQKLGWSGGSVEQYAAGKCIGGSYFGNNEGILPDAEYHECDIDTLGASKRGAKRIVYSTDGDIYYTEDHYETFTLLYTADGPATEEVVYSAQ